ncbi:MAG: hypothetical protein H0W65_11205 [Sphingomonas sp.]|uniref:hypothetical protein n=1 Tax=Sphingomonas sp. TaxID=28214 RepID=UPI00181427A0|nr:hypothetical protein [Sphingomonas sp.]MBA3668269.1 hypothetical protein [Sphingomonas sp.]
MTDKIKRLPARAALSFLLIAALSAGGLANAAPSPAASPAPAPKMRTIWSIETSVGLDAIAFLSALSLDPFYRQHYEKETSGFLPRLTSGFSDRVASIKDKAKAQDIMMSPILDLILSGAPHRTMADVIAALDHPERIRGAFAHSSNWDAKEWDWFSANAPQLAALLREMDHAGFTDFRSALMAPIMEKRFPEVKAYLAKYDVIAEQEKLTGRTFDPTIHVIGLYFTKPHGIRVQGQTFLISFSYPDDTIVFGAGHEMLHPPIPMDGALARRLIAIVAADPVLKRAIAEHDRSFGYTTAEGMVNEDLVQALDQIISDKFGLRGPAARRWRKADGGMHLLAAAVYQMLMRDGYPLTGGNFELWLDRAIAAGRFAPGPLHEAAAATLGVPADRLWPPAF